VPGRSSTIFNPNTLFTGALGDGFKESTWRICHATSRGGCRGISDFREIGTTSPSFGAKSLAAMMNWKIWTHQGQVCLGSPQGKPYHGGTCPSKIPTIQLALLTTCKVDDQKHGPQNL
jgi:hypothetical protein